MVTKANQLEPASQIQAGINQLADELNAATETIRRLTWLKEKLAVQIAEMSATKESLEFYTEAEAAVILKVDPDKPERAETQLASLRRQFDLPHCKVGKKVRYTNDHLHEICSILEMNSQQKASMNRAA